MKNLSQEEIKEIIMKSDQTIYFPLEDLQFAFGFNRVHGLEHALNKISNPDITEERLLFSSDYEIKSLIQVWCGVNNIYFDFDEVAMGFHFKKKKSEIGAGYENYRLEPNPVLFNRSFEFKMEKENEKLKESFSKISKAKDQVEEALVIQVLTQLLKRKPGVEDFKKVTRVFGPPEINPHSFVETLQKYTLVYSGVTLGVVVLERLPHSKMRYIFYPDKIF